ncbi:MAG: RsbRD N-terminal domain-containing protein [Desulfobulbales bacterium]|nr:RsbRD N-terminal domain-containing protein [Desulfobulbales bacterium]
MNIETLLAQKKKAVVQVWIDRALDSYGSPEFFKKQKDRFANPVGATISEGLHDLYAVLLEGRALEEAAKPLENIIKIRAVQDLKPSEAVFFVYVFKNIVRQELAGEKDREAILAALAALDAKIDAVALMAFDFYMDCRERLHKIRVNEVLSGRSALTDGTKCISGMLKRNGIELEDNNQNNRLT